MNPIVARCGNRCDQCPLFKTNFTAEAAAGVNAGLYKYHHGGHGPAPHYTRGCDGCLSDGYVLREGCDIRSCVLRRHLTSCAGCEHLYCELLERDMKIVEAALSKHRKLLPQQDFERFFRPFLIRQALARLREENRRRR